jgi:site-specific DNA-methyltransferase (adenine-specific)
MSDLRAFAQDYPHQIIGNSVVIQADCMAWLARLPESSLHAIVTDPPYGVKEYEETQLAKRLEQRRGIWRIPPAFDGHQRAPLPRFAALSDKERRALEEFFVAWASLAVRALRPGGHAIIASNTLLSQLTFSAFVKGGFEFRGQIIRVVRTLRGGDRPKNAEDEFAEVCTLPRSNFEPWALLRKPLPPKMTVSDCLREYQTGALRRSPNGSPFNDLIPSGRTPQRERAIADHPSLKPQALMRQLVYAVLPLGVGIVADPFMGSGATVAAAEALGLSALGVERNPDYYRMSLNAIPRLAALTEQFTLLE